MGAVYEAHDSDTRTPVALKVNAPLERIALFPDTVANDDLASGMSNQILREGEILQSLHHRGVVEWVDQGTSEIGHTYLATKWIVGETLARRLARGVLEMHEVFELGACVAGALRYVHERGVVHRDVKPSNIVLAEGVPAWAVLIDFGVAHAKSRREPPLPRGSVLGTLGYMAPEQARGETQTSPSTDIFSLGCVLFECLTGRLPFGGANAVGRLRALLLDEAPRVDRMVSAVPRDVASLIARMLAREPADRLTCAGEVERCLRSAALEGRRSSGHYPPKRREFSDHERAIVTVVVVMLPSCEGSSVAEDASGFVPASSPPIWDDIAAEATHPFVPPAARRQVLLDLREHAAPFGVLECLGSDVAVVVIPGGDHPADTARRAVRCGLHLLSSDVRTGVVTVSAPVHGPVAIGEVLESAQTLLDAAE
jgi:serine/threonine protein kinase